MRHRTALKVKVGHTIHLKPQLGARKYIVTKIYYGPGAGSRVKYPLFKTENNGVYSYMLVRIAQNRKGQIL